MSVPKNNHFIPKFYIVKWKFNDKQVYYLDKKQSKIINTNPRNIFADRIWDSEVENEFSRLERESWIPVINKILKNKTMDLSESDLESFLSFFLTLKVRNKEYVVESYETVTSNLAKSDSKLVRDGKVTEKNMEEYQKNNKQMLNDSFLSSHSPAGIFKEGSSFNKLKRLNFDIKIIEEKDAQYGQFLTSNYPAQMLNKENEVCLIMMISLSPNLLVFGAKEVETFIALNNKPINIFIEEFNKYIYNNSKCIVSNKKSLLEQFMQ